MKKRVWLTRALTFGMAVLSMPTLALAQTHLGPCNGCGAVHVQLGATGELTGAGVVVPVTVACIDNAIHADIKAHVRQVNSSGSTAAGEGDLPVEPCGSTPQTVHVTVPYGGRIDLGRAAASAELDACDSTGNNCNIMINTAGIDIVD
jgi:hypothetical protein